MKVNDTLSTLLDKVRALAKSETVVGDPIVVQDVTLIPISRVSVGFAAGSAERENLPRKNGGEGAGGGITITPLVVVVVKKGQESRLLWIEKEDRSVNKFLDLVPGILDRFVPEVKKDEKEAEIR
ncbi:MAG: spore germination protein GerW family protein [Candidatus Marinimicrobia bacterium]|nr:spore germination protein GerW family protein [Candidatus Neomarinimicrobiota bacterium]MDD4961253.1 spore germination protein GerW family protein [Candidatus Neomarinimicrobiota bacterium]MDD5710116.1 spore germination protein GerW family protein [Candidatus Neomarinimicrobiota bacterium]